VPTLIMTLIVHNRSLERYYKPFRIVPIEYKKLLRKNFK
jgi:hypothetical protein